MNLIIIITPENWTSAWVCSTEALKTVNFATFKLLNSGQRYISLSLKLSWWTLINPDRYTQDFFFFFCTLVVPNVIVSWPIKTKQCLQTMTRSTKELLSPFDLFFKGLKTWNYPAIYVKINKDQRKIWTNVYNVVQHKCFLSKTFATICPSRTKFSDLRLKPCSRHQIFARARQFGSSSSSSSETCLRLIASRPRRWHWVTYSN